MEKLPAAQGMGREGSGEGGGRACRERIGKRRCCSRVREADEFQIFLR